MIIARETSLANSEAEIAISNAATLLASASRMISGEVVPNFEAIVEQNEMSFAQKRKDVSAVQALLNDENAVAPTLQKAAETIRNMRALSEAIMFDAIAPVQIPAKPLPEGSLLRDTLRRLHYVQKVVEAVAKWTNDVGEHECLKVSALYAKTQQDLIRAFRRVVIQLQQAAVIIGKYRDMGDIRLLREMTLDAQAALSELTEADESVSEKRKSIPIFKRALEESKAAPKVARQLVSIAAGLAVVLGLSFVIIKLHSLAPQAFQASEPASEFSFEPEPLPQQSLQQEISVAQPPTISEPAIEPTANKVPMPSQTPAPTMNEKPVEPRRNDNALATKPLALPIADAQPKTKVVTKATEAKENKQPEENFAETKPAKPTPTTAPASEIKAKPNLAPPLKKTANATSTTTEKTSTRASTSKSEPPKTESENDQDAPKNSERAMPKRKTIVIED